MTWNNLLTWSLQILLLVATAAVAAVLLRVHIPSARLFYWQVVLVACLALPLVRPWEQEAVTGTVSFSMTIIQPAQESGRRGIPLAAIALWMIPAGALARAVWLAVGFRRLRQYRRRSTLFEFREGVTLLLSRDITGPVTWGVRNPVILLPARFPELEPRIQEAILCHELLHVRRRDWLFTVAEELVRTAFWFHPAVWWVLGQIQLAREQSVDRQVIEGTCSREEYVDALLAIARGRFRLDLAPASLFLRKRHLKQRLVSILKEVRMSKTRLFSLLALDLGVLAAACWLITAAFPLRAAPQEVVDAPGVTLENPEVALMHRAPVVYPEAARKQGIQGTVTVQVRIDSGGNVADAQVLSGPDQLRKPVLQSVLHWHFAKEAAGTTRQVSIVFQLPTDAGRQTTQIPPPAQPAGLGAGQAGQVLKSITMVGLSEQARADLLSRLPVHEGDLFGPVQSIQVIRVLKDFDDHLALTLTPVAGGGSGLTIGPSELLQPAFPPPPSADSQPGPQRIRVGGNMQALKLVSQAKTVYPPLAKQSRVEGIVSLNAVIGKDGTMQNLTVISGHPLLVPAALEAVQQWTYQPTLLNGAPIEVVTQIDVNFTLAR